MPQGARHEKRRGTGGQRITIGMIVCHKDAQETQNLE
jgi:hypothetical protein